jgi:hypothetical protein
LPSIAATTACHGRIAHLTRAGEFFISDSAYSQFPFDLFV